MSMKPQPARPYNSGHVTRQFVFRTFALPVAVSASVISMFGGAGVPTPCYARSATVHNEAPKPVTVTIVYSDNQNNKEIEETATLEANTVKEFDEQVIDMGSWQAVAPVKTVTVKDGHNKNVSLAPAVSGVMRTVHFHVKPNLHLEQGAAS
uniref:Uncharacterized protein n=2 Tax=Chlamydomonas leiostraca TaxID=1034604 RepID=A0A7S0R8G9_9CHLO|mmetsp:Transcript_16429/g.40992  ORF Transcript_16429/g.40992 Transcript_16429/m.40992 type:complete len:151 (+) Transcript_16429:232-684(+)